MNAQHFDFPLWSSPTSPGGVFPATPTTTDASSTPVSPRVTKALDALQRCADMEVIDSESDESEAEDIKHTAPIPAFVKRLKTLVDDPEFDGLVWSDDGNSIIITNPDTLTEQLGRHVKTPQKITSFVRQLHFYGFKKAGTGLRGPGSWAYTHKYFQRDGHNIRRVRKSKGGVDKQVQTLKSKVAHLNTALVDTQKRLTDVASAILSLLQHPPSTSSSSSSSSRGSSTSDNGVLLPESDQGFSSFDSVLRMQAPTKRSRDNHSVNQEL